jgi:predicted N-acetyltransferase YhbS
MAVKYRPYNPETDIKKIGDLLSESYQPGNRDGNWIRPIWDYASLAEPAALARIGVWEEGGQVVAATIFDDDKICLCTDPDHQGLKDDMRRHAESNLSTEYDGERSLNIYVYDFDTEQKGTLEAADYMRSTEKDMTLCVMQIPSPFSVPELPEGFSFKSLEDEIDLRKIHHVLYRGFNHPGEPPEDEIEARGLILTCPTFRKDLTIVCEAPSGNYATYCGMWIDEPNQYCYVEPVATDPDFRRRGLGSATVLESVRRCGLLGAEIAYVWSDTGFYRSMGFEPNIRHHCWTKNLSTLLR